MVVKRETVITRLENLDRIVSELNQYAGLTYSQYSAELRHQWVIERGLIAAAGVILDIAEHILVAHFGEYSGTYEKSLAAIHQRSVISAQTYQHLRGLAASETSSSISITRSTRPRCGSIITRRSPFSRPLGERY